ncbi:hypothetical protein M2650_00150 [Luteimonas sp. SX5]|uniref:Uncharacterized protein n=1 Tax=Luteimonas galliterrae TaxID=2940486 RepID=A0ABT0MDW5_9GAMM|nr:hypothetical protein [Luteimonas galliterrae]MCL1633062.1 hypothetical protein [Luteimonas galliterrae]
MNDSWIACPFKQGGAYRVRRDFTALRCSFRAGEILIFKSVAWSRYDGMLGFFFGQPGSEGTWAWDIEDDADLQVWKELFEEVPDAV